MTIECDMWDAGALIQASWHRKEKIQPMANAAEMIEAGESLGAWPIATCVEEMRTPGGLIVPGKAVVATYRPGSRPGDKRMLGDRMAHGAVGDRYTPLSPAEWRATIEAAVLAGAKPAGTFSLYSGHKVLATFEIPSALGHKDPIASFLMLLDSLDGSCGYSAGSTDIRVVCRNTLRAALKEDKHAHIRHTASVNDLARKLRETIEVHIKTGETVRKLYQAAKDTVLSKADAQKLFDDLFPEPTPDQRKLAQEKKGGAQATVTKLERERTEALQAMKDPVNFEGKGSVATLWNGATYTVTHKADGSDQDARKGAEMIDSLLLGSRAKRIQEIQNKVIQVLMKDGSVQNMSAPEAASHGIDAGQIGKALLGEMLN